MEKTDIWSQASYRYPISWEAFLPNIRFLPSTVTKKNVTKNILDRRTEVKQYTPSPFGEWGIKKVKIQKG
jgi:hypothetical protein